MPQPNKNSRQKNGGLTNVSSLNKFEAKQVSAKLSTEEYEDLFFPNFLDEKVLKSKVPKKYKYHHLGFQFVFKNMQSGVYSYLETIEIYWVVYRRKLNSDNTHDSAFIRLRMRDNFGLDIQNPESNPNFKDLEPGKFFSIEQYKSGQTHSHYGVANQPIVPTETRFNFNSMTRVAYRRLDFFEDNTNIDFVYFTCDQLRHFFHYYESLIISGSQIKFGKQLTHRISENQKNYEEKYFTLKIEGKGHKVSTSKTISKSPNENDESTPGTEVAIGQPCPPRWFSFSTILAQLNRIYTIPADEVKNLSNLWNIYNYKDQI